MQPKWCCRNDLQRMWELQNDFLLDTGQFFWQHLISAPPPACKHTATPMHSTLWTARRPPRCHQQQALLVSSHPPRQRTGLTQDMGLILPSARAVGEYKSFYCT